MRYVLLTFLSVITVVAGCASRNQFGSQAVQARDDVPRQVTVLADDLSPLRERFNADSGRWRVVALVSPTCSACVLGAEVVQKEITARYPQQQVAALIVWIPMLKTDNEKAASSSAMIYPLERADQYYDSQQGVGWAYARGPFAGFPQRARKSLPEGRSPTDASDDRAERLIPQWDLYMLYAPGVKWEPGSAPPPPTHWIRHLGRKQDGKTSIYWQDAAESGPHEGDLHAAIRQMAENAIGKPNAMSGM